MVVQENIKPPMQFEVHVNSGNTEFKITGKEGWEMKYDSGRLTSSSPFVLRILIFSLYLITV